MGEKSSELNGAASGASNYGEERSALELRGEIEETRAELSKTIDALQARLNPQTIKENLINGAREATIERVKIVGQAIQKRAGQLQESAAPAIEMARDKATQVTHSAQNFVRKLRGEEVPEATSSTRNAENVVLKLKPISEQVVVVFGASSGIGRETAIQFARRGAKVVVAARGHQALETLVQSIHNLGGEAVSVVADATDAAQVNAVAERAVAEFGRLDTWVHCAGISIYAPFAETSPAEFKQIIDTNLIGQAYGAMAALPHLKREGRGALIHVSSVEAKRAFPLQSAYSSSKHGIVGFLDALRLELQNEGSAICVTNVMPSGINTPLFNHARTKLGVKPMPAPPIYQPQVVAEVILHAAENPTRDIYAGGAGRAMAALQKLSPALMDKILVKSAFEAQKTKEAKSLDAPDNLQNAIESHGQIGGDFSEQSRTKSLSNWLEVHPQTQRALKTVALCGVALWIWKRKRGR